MYTANQNALIEKLRPAASTSGVVGNVARDIWEICKNSDDFCAIVAKDLDNKEMSVENCEKQIHQAADEKHKKAGGNVAGISDDEAKNIIRKFYGLPLKELPEDPFAPDEEKTEADPEPEAENGSPFGVSLEDFL